MNLNIKSGTVGYNNKVLISDDTFSLGKNDKVNTSELVKEGDKPKSHKAVVQPTITHKTLAHEEEKLLWYSYSLEALLLVYVLINRSLRLVNNISSTTAAI